MKKKTFCMVGAAWLLLSALVISCTIKINAATDADRQYFCDYQNLSLHMRVAIDDGNGKKYNIDGELFAAYEDDLAMADADGNLVRHTNDVYNFVSQNEHMVYDQANNLLYRCDGKIKIFADSYDVYDAAGNHIAYVKFNVFDSKGTMTDVDGHVIARYDSAWSRRDYVVSIYDECEIDDESVLMIFASYVSDLRSDSSN
jgi:uncharacterized protein YxjI